MAKEIAKLREQNKRLQERITALESKVSNSVPVQTHGSFYRLISSSLTQVFLAMLAFGAAFSGRLDSFATSVSIVIAAAIGVFGFWAHLGNRLWAMAASAALVLFLWWANGYLLEPMGELSMKQGELLTALLKTAKAVPDYVELSCPEADEDACVYANSFVPRFQRAGWKVKEHNGMSIVERVRLGRPNKRVAIVHKGPPLVHPQNPDEGVWTQVGPWDQILTTALLVGAEIPTDRLEELNDPGMDVAQIRVHFGAVPRR